MQDMNWVAQPIDLTALTRRRGDEQPRAKGSAEAGEKDVARQEALVRALQERTRRDWEYVLGDERGRRCLQNLILICNPDASMLPQFYADQHARDTAIGAREIGLWLRHQVRAIDPSAVERMGYEFSLPPTLETGELATARPASPGSSPPGAVSHAQP
jgi:hypothetical protein